MMDLIRDYNSITILLFEILAVIFVSEKSIMMATFFRSGQLDTKRCRLDHFTFFDLKDIDQILPSHNFLIRFNH